MNTGEMIKEIRIKSLLNQSEFANELGVTFTTVNRWENNRCTPNYKALKKIKLFCMENKITFNLENMIISELKQSKKD